MVSARTHFWSIRLSLTIRLREIVVSQVNCNDIVNGERLRVKTLRFTSENVWFTSANAGFILVRKGLLRNNLREFPIFPKELSNLRDLVAISRALRGGLKKSVIR